ncbi:MAG: hypothetical protein GY702_07780 [Desulfobulbaceae bacterium]|nr:hypothetical protein [Desulfobulbaceae bacterium]
MAGLSLFAKAAGEGRLTVVILVVEIPSAKPTVWLSKNIGGQQKAGRSTGRRKGDEGCKFLKKPWLMHLQHRHSGMIGYPKITCLSFLVVIFAVEKV